MIRTFKCTVFALLLCLFVVVPSRAQDSKDCTIMTVTNVSPGFLGGHITDGFEGTPTVTDGNRLVLGAFVTFSATCQAGQGAAVTSASQNPLAIGNLSQDTIPIGCAPGATAPPPAGGCPSLISPPNTSYIYCEGFFNASANQPVSYTAGNNNTFTITATSATVVTSVFGPSCSFTNATAQTACTPTSCPLKSITVATLGGAPAVIQVGNVQRYTATGNYSDGSMLDLSPSNLTSVPTQWTSQNTNIATITSPTNNPSGGPAGIATGRGAGQTTVTATNGSISGNALIDVVNPPPPPPPPCTICPKIPPVTCYSPCGSPIILDLTGRGFYLTSAQNGVMFDITGEGKLWQMGWIAQGADNAFLALPGADGLVHSGKQLFGNFTPQPPSADPNGFAALAVYDDPKNGGNGDGVIDSRDAIFASLRLWIDANHDGISQPDELHTLASLGVNSISLKYKSMEKTDQYGNVFGYRARVNGNESQDVGQTAYDVFFVVLPPPAAKNNLLNPEGNKCTVPTNGVTKGGMLSTSSR
jgi:hypothetical protein